MALSGEFVFGSFSYPRVTLDLQKHKTLFQRADGSGRHVVSLSGRFGVSGTQTPIYDAFFAGGYSTLRGFNFRGASPVVMNVPVGGNFQMLGTAQYMFPLVASDMVRGVTFVDFGTVEEDVRFDADTFRIAPGAGLRITVPALGPAPIALDFAFPIARAPTDDIQNFSLFVGLNF
jgi:outer membrane protein insertion porin family